MKDRIIHESYRGFEPADSRWSLTSVTGAAGFSFKIEASTENNDGAGHLRSQLPRK